MRVRGEWNASTRRVEFKYTTSRIRVRDEARVRRYLRAVPYVHKGCDQAMFTLQSGQVDEISDYQNAHYVSSNEAVWRILEFPIHERDPPVQQLAIYLENGQRVYFTEETAMDRASGDPPKTTLIEFFVLCRRDDFAKT